MLCLSSSNTLACQASSPALAYVSLPFSHLHPASQSDTSHILSQLAYAMFFIGALAVVMGPASLIADRWGRKWGMLAGQICIVIATFILLFSPTLHAFYAGRFVLGLGAGLALAVAPPYVGESNSLLYWIVNC